MPSNCVALFTTLTDADACRLDFAFLSIIRSAARARGDVLLAQILREQGVVLSHERNCDPKSDDSTYSGSMLSQN